MRRTGSPSARALGALLLVVAGAAMAAEVEFYQAVDRNEVGTEDMFRLTIVSSGAPDGSQVKLPATEDFEVFSRSQSTDMSIQMVGPGPATIKRTQKTVLTMRARRAGTLTIPGAQLVTERQTYKADPITLKVVKGRTRPDPRSQPPDPMDPFANLRPRGDEDEGVGMDVDIPRSDSDLFLKLAADRESVYVGEQVTLSLYIFSRVDLSDVSSLNLPVDGFWTEDVDTPTQLVSEQRVINGIPYRMYLLRRRALFPMKAGTVKLGPAAADMVTGFLFAGRRVHRKSNEVELKVKPLPPQGKPPSFNGNNVGQWRLTVEANPTQVELGQPVTVKVSLDGRGNLRNVAMPPLTGPTSLRIYAPTTTDNVLLSKGRIGGNRTQEYLVMAQQTGELVLPSLAFHYFNPETGEYEVSRTDPITLSVRPGAGAPPVAAQGNGTSAPLAPAVAAPDPGGARNVLASGGLRPLRYKADFAPKSEPLWKRGFFAPAVAAPLALWLGVLAVGFVRARLGREDAGSLSRKRTRAARKRLAAAEGLKAQGKPDAFYGEVEKAVMGFLEAKLGGPVVGLTRDGLAERMRASGVPADRQQLVLRVLESCDLGRFAPGAGDQARDQVLADAEAAMEGWER